MPLLAYEMRSISPDGVAYGTFHIEERIEESGGWKRLESVQAVSKMPEASRLLVVKPGQRVIFEAQNDSGIETLRGTAPVVQKQNVPSRVASDDDEDGPTLFNEEETMAQDEADKKRQIAMEEAKKRLAADRSVTKGPSIEAPSVPATAPTPDKPTFVVANKETK